MPSPKASAFRTDIEGLRGIAILLVIAFHAHIPGFRGGFIGVDVFFVLSGYLITGLIVKEILSTGTLDLAAFYARRARRLLPASATVVIVVVCVSAVVFPPFEQERVARTAIATGAYLSNAYFIWLESDYFAPAFEVNPLLHTWSLAVEEQFYLVWPVLILLGLKGARSRRRLLVVMTGISVLSLVACIRWTSTHHAWAFYGSPARAWEFGLGGLASLLAVPTSRVGCAWTRVGGWLGLAAVLGAAIGFSSSTAFPGTAALLPAAGTAAILIAGAGTSSTGLGRFLNIAPLQRCGELSYSWYLWHWPPIAMLSAVLPGMADYGRIPWAVASYFAAVLTHRYVENPIRFHPRLVRRSVLSLGLAAILTTAVVGFSGFWRQILRHTPQYQTYGDIAHDIPLPYKLGCVAEYGDEKPKECSFGEANSTTTVVLMGDSHAAQWFPALVRIATQEKWRLITLIKSSCPAASLPVFHNSSAGPEVQCAQWRQLALRRIAALRPRMALLASASIYGKQPDGKRGLVSFSYDEWSEGTRKTLLPLNAAGVRTVLLRDTPKPRMEIPLCLSRLNWRDFGSDSCSTLPSLALDPNLFRAEQRAASGLPHVSVIDLSGAICNSNTCEPVRSGIIVYRDAHHLSVAFAETLAPALGKHLAQWIPPADNASMLLRSNPLWTRSRH